jgi:hypothetical protein
MVSLSTSKSSEILDLQGVKKIRIKRTNDLLKLIFQNIVTTFLLKYTENFKNIKFTESRTDLKIMISEKVCIVLFIKLSIHTAGNFR